MHERPTKVEDRVPKASKIGYGLGMASQRLQNGSFNQMANPIFNDILGIDPRLIGLCLGFSRIFDAITDPIIGFLSDNTKTKLGRRRPWIAGSSLFCALSFIAIWAFPSGMSTNFYVGWFVISSVVFFFFLSMFSVPYNALGMELTPDYHERTSVMAYKSVVAKAGGFLTSSIYLFISADHFENIAEGMRHTAIWLGLLVFVFTLLPALLVKEHPTLTERHKERGMPKINLLDSIKLSMKNGPFLILIGVTLIMIFGLTMVNFLSYYIIIYHIFDGAKTEHSGLILALCGYGAQVGGLIGIPVMAFVSRRIGKRKTLLFALVVAFLSDLLKWLCFTPACPYLTILPGFIAGFALVSVWTLMQAMLPDVVDQDELQTYTRREGMFSAIMSWTIKVGMSLALIISGFILSSSGFDSSLGGGQLESSITHIRVCYTVIPAIAMILGFVLMYFYPLTENRSYEIRAKLETRNGA
ncbi:MAG: MFS transporter [Verrucomicrobiota bacterium]